MKRVLVFLSAVLLIILISPAPARACGKSCNCGSAKQKSTTNASSAAAVNVGNTICPVMGQKIVSGHAVAIEYNGKIYNLCCAGCIGPFQKNPQKYIEQIVIQSKDAPDENSCNAVKSCQG